MKTLKTWARINHALQLRGSRGSSSPSVPRVGDEHARWGINVGPQPVVAYCSGAVRGMRFEVELTRMTSRSVRIFNPSPPASTPLNSDMCLIKDNANFAPKL